MKRLILILGLLFYLAPPATAAEPIRVGAVYALTGVAAKGALEELSGVEAAAKEINEAGGLLGRPVELTVYDNHSTPIGSKLAAEQAVRDGVTGVVGASWSSHTLASARVSQAHGIPQISSMSTHPEVTAIGDCVYRVCFTDPFQGRVTARFAAQDLKLGDVVILKDLNSAYSLSLAEHFREHFVKLGGTIPLELGYKQHQRNAGHYIEQIKRVRPDGVFIPGHNESGQWANIIRKAKIAPVMLGGDGWSSKAFLRSGGDQILVGYYCTHWSPQIDTPRSQAFVRRYAEHPHLSAGMALGYDAFNLLAEGIRRAGSDDPGEVCAALSGIRDFAGVTGRIGFDENRNPRKQAVIMEIRRGVPWFYRIISPDHDQH